MWIRRISVMFAFVCLYLLTLCLICFFSSPHTMLTHCCLCFQTDYVKKKSDSSKPSFTIYVLFFFNFFHVSLAQSCAENIWKTFPRCTWWIADDRCGSQVWLVSSARLRLCLHRMWPWRRACNLEMMPGTEVCVVTTRGEWFEASSLKHITDHSSKKLIRQYNLWRQHQTLLSGYFDWCQTGAKTIRE